MAMPAGTEFISEDMEIAEDPDVQRTPFDDGASRQQRVYTESYTVHRLAVRLRSDADMETFRSWARREAHTWFSWASLTDGVVRRVRVRGGRAGVTYDSQPGGSLGRWWIARFELEGLRSDTV